MVPVIETDRLRLRAHRPEQYVTAPSNVTKKIFFLGRFAGRLKSVGRASK